MVCACVCVCVRVCLCLCVSVCAYVGKKRFLIVLTVMFPKHILHPNIHVSIVESHYNVHLRESLNAHDSCANPGENGTFKIEYTSTLYQKKEAFHIFVTLICSGFCYIVLGGNTL